jgi:hypothetical protein
MKRTILTTLLLLWAAGPTRAQEGEAKPPATRQDPEAAYQELARALNKAVADWQEEMRNSVRTAQEEGKPIPAISMTPPTKEFIARAQQLAAAHKGTDDAVRFLAFICKNASREAAEVQAAVKTLLAEHAGSKAIGAVLPHLDGAAFAFDSLDDVMALFDAVIASNKDAGCQAQALLARGEMRLQTAATDAERKAAKEDLLRVAQVTGDEGLRQQAKDALFEIEHLQVGCKAPDIVAKDTDGAEMKLSDYRGKVILLDFWGFW